MTLFSGGAASSVRPGVLARVVLLAALTVPLGALAGPTSCQTAMAFEPAKIQDVLDQLKDALSNNKQGIVDLLEQLDPVMLNGVIERLPLRDYLYESALRLLSVDRVLDLSIENRFKIIAAIQSGWTRKHEENAIASIVLNTHGDALTRLKRLLDVGSAEEDLMELVFHDVDDSTLRDQILAHFQREVAASPRTQVTVLSDIDDTFYRNWVDPRYPAKTIYPGVKAFYRELRRDGKLTFLSARPDEPTEILKRKTHDMLKQQGLEDFTVLTGDLKHVHSNQAIADKKVENFRRYRELFPEFSFVFVGDNGQGDHLAGRVFMSEYDRAEFSGVFIHRVAEMDEATVSSLGGAGVFLFDTYIGAAKRAFELGLISHEGLDRVRDEAMREFEAIQFESPEQKDRIEQMLERDSE